MLKEVVSFISDELNTFIKTRLELNEDKVVISNFMNQDGTLALQEENKIVVSMINLEQETVVNTASVRALNTQVAYANPPLYLNVYLLFSAFFGGSNYTEALKFLSLVIRFFQGKHAYDHQNSPAMPDNIEKLIFKMVTLDYQELSHMWGMLGSKYMPSAIYQMRMITIDDQLITDTLPAVSGSDTSAEKR
ncbi:MAG: DUF4255 domain-containing protein [Bacteroidota bacterium]